MNNTLLTSLATFHGIVAGGSGMWFTVKDRMTKEVEERVTIVTKITQLEEKLYALEQSLK